MSASGAHAIIDSAISNTDTAKSLGANEFYARGFTGTRAVVANMEYGYCWDGHETLSPLGSSLIKFSDPSNPASSPGWDDYHATSVCQIIAGRGTTSIQRGVAYGATLWSAALGTSFVNKGNVYSNDAYVTPLSNIGPTMPPR
jgi:hypothetical protein